MISSDNLVIIRGETTDQVKEIMNGCHGARGGDRSRLQRGAEEFFRGKELFYLTVPLWWGRTTLSICQNLKNRALKTLNFIVCKLYFNSKLEKNHL